MNQVKNFGSQNLEDYKREIDRGGKFVMYSYCISIIIMTFRQSSSIYFIKGGESRVFKGLGFTLLTFILGWWGIPWGPIYTFQSLYRNLSGGLDVTTEVMQAVEQDLDVRNQYS